MLDLGSSRAYVHQLREVLATLPAEQSPESVEENHALIDAVGRPEWAIPMLRQVLDDGALLADVSSRSYRHVNHFDKIVLVGNDDPSGYRLTLHLWSPPYTEDELTDELIHDHRFSFWSSVLTGTLTSENFEKHPEGVVLQKYRYIPEKRDRNFLDFYEFRGEERLRQTDPFHREVGDSYYLDGPAIHQVLLPRTSMVCTLVLRGPRLRSYANVFNTEYPKANTQFDNSMFSERQLAEKLVALLAAMEKDQS